MAIPELEPKPTQPTPEQVDIRQEQAEISKDVEQATGASVVPAQPDPLVDPDSNLVIAQPVPPPPEPAGPSITIPIYQSEEQVEQYAHGNPSDAITWQAVGVIRKIHIAVKKGIRVIFGQS